MPMYLFLSFPPFQDLLIGNVPLLNADPLKN